MADVRSIANIELMSILPTKDVSRAIVCILLESLAN